MANGIASGRQGGIPTFTAARGAGEGIVTPAIADLSAAIRSGYITIDDIFKRSRATSRELEQRPAEAAEAQLRTQQAQTGQALLPSPEEIEQARRIRGAQAAQTELGLTDPLAVAQQQGQQALAQEAVSLFGALPPQIQEPPDLSPKNVQTFEEFVETQVAPKITFSPDATPEERGALFSRAGLEAKKEYDRLIQINDPTILKKKPMIFGQGDPEYFQKLSEQVQKRKTQQLIQAAGIKAATTPPKTAQSQRINPQTGLVEEVLVEVKPGGGVVSETVIGAKPPTPTEAQSNAAIFSSRLSFNDKILTDLEGRSFDPTTIGTASQKFLPNILRSSDVQSYNSAKDNWIAAVLRKESGATITPAEMRAATQQYFPLTGDSASVVKQKQNLRRLAEQEMKKIASPGVTPTAPPEVPTVTPRKYSPGDTIKLKSGRTGVVDQVFPDGTFTLR